MMTKINTLTNTPKSRILLKISIFLLIFIIASEIVSFLINYNSEIKNISYKNIKDEFGFNVLLNNFIIIIIAPIIEEITFRYSINGFFKNLSLKLYSYIGFIFAIIVAFLPIAKIFDRNQFIDKLYSGFNTKNGLDKSNFTYILEILIPIIIFIFVFIIFKFFEFNPLKIVKSVNNFVNRSPISLYFLSSVTWIIWHFHSTSFNGAKWVDWLFLVNLILASFVFAVFTRFVSLKAAILVHMIHNAFIIIMGLILKLSDFRNVYAIFISIFIIYAVYSLYEEMEKFRNKELSQQLT